MLQITSWEQLETVPDPHIRSFLEYRRAQLTSDGPYDPEEDGGFLIVEYEEEINTEFDFIGTNGIYSDLFDESPPFADGFVSPFEYACSHPRYALHEFYLQLNDSKGLVILIPDAVVAQSPDLRRLLDLLSVPVEVAP